VEVFELAGLLADAIALEPARKELLDRVVTLDAFGKGLAPELREWFESLPPAELARYLIGGVIGEDLPFRPDGGGGASFEPTPFVPPPPPHPDAHGGQLGVDVRGRLDQPDGLPGPPARDHPPGDRLPPPPGVRGGGGPGVVRRGRRRPHAGGGGGG